MKSVPAGHNRSRGITLVEVLVVIAVIGILAGIMFPILAGVRAVERKSICQANLKQLYTAFQMYADDWGNTLPCPGGLYGNQSYWAQEGGGGIEAYLRCQQMGLRSAYCCPSYTGRWGSQYSPRTYGMNSFLREPWDAAYPSSVAYLKGIRQSRIVSPSRTILLYEGIPAAKTHYLGEGYVYRCANWQWVRGYWPRPVRYWQDADKPWHGQMNNYLMCDGHVITRPPERYPAFRGPTSPANNFWYVAHLR